MARIGFRLFWPISLPRLSYNGAEYAAQENRMDQETTLADVVEVIEKLDGRVSDMSVDVAWIKESLKTIENLLEAIKDKL